MPARALPRVSLIGAGAVGSALATALFELGYPIACVISRSGKSAIALAKSVKCKKVSTTIHDIDAKSDIILIAVADGSISDIAGQLARVKSLKFQKLFVIHTSGVHGADVLQPLKGKGALTASMHPIQSFPGTMRSSQLRARLRGISYGIEGEPAACTKAERLVNDLGGKAVIIPREMKPLYHVACVFASSYLVIMLNAITELTKTLQLKSSWMEVFGPLLTATMENTIKETAPRALTGPILRGDHETLQLHLEALASHAPQFLPLYTIAGIEVARIAQERGTIGNQEFQQIMSLFRNFVKSTSTTKQTKRPH